MNEEPYLCLVIIDLAHTSSVQLLLDNLTIIPLQDQKEQLLGYEKIMESSDILSLHPFSGFEEFNLQSDDPATNDSSLIMTSHTCLQIRELNFCLF